MANKTLADEIISLIQSYSNNNPPPISCKIIGNYDDEPYSDVKTEEFGKISYIKTIGSTKIGLDGVICFINGDLKQGVVITSSDCEYHSDIDLLDFYVDFNLNFSVSGRDDIITVETFLKEK